MGQYVNWIEYKGKRIMVVTYAGLHDEEVYLRAVDEFEAETLAQPAGHQFRVIVDVRDSALTQRITQRNKEVMNKSKEHGIPDCPTALVGLTGLKLAVVQALQFFRPDLHVAESFDAAKEWLVSQQIEE
jgi:hypothetical protein